MTGLVFCGLVSDSYFSCLEECRTRVCLAKGGVDSAHTYVCLVDGSGSGG